MSRKTWEGAIKHTPKKPPLKWCGEEVILTVYEAARLFRLPRQVVLRYIQRRKLPAIVAEDGTYRLDIRDVLSWRRRLRPRTTDKKPPGYTAEMRATGHHSETYRLKLQRASGRIPKRKSRGRDIRSPKRKHLESLGLWPQYIEEEILRQEKERSC